MMIDFALCERGNLSRSQVEEFMDTGRYYMEEKLDGVRVIVHKKLGSVFVYTRSGQDISFRVPEVTRPFYNFGFSGQDLMMDGELVGPDFRSVVSRVNGNSSDPQYLPAVEFRPFDILLTNGTDCRHKSFALRRTMLVEYCPRIGLRPPGLSKHLDFYDDTLQSGGEGVVLKPKDSLYYPGRGSGWLRSKFRNTLTAYPIRIDDKDRAVFGVWDGTKTISIGTVDLPDDDLLLVIHELMDKTRPEQGNLTAEIEAYGVDIHSRLRHPVFKGLRYDISPVGCTADQLEMFRLY
jgi:ATP-dependent DNA ligase